MRKIQEERIFQEVAKVSDEKTAQKVVYGKESENGDTAWVKHTMKRLEETFPASEVGKIRRNCQCGYGMEERVKLVKHLVASSSTLEEFVGQEKAKAAGLLNINGELYLTFLSCGCPMLAEVERLETNTWCLCTTGYSKVLFEKAFGFEVEVTLIKSIKMGDECCLMKITPSKPIWD